MAKPKLLISIHTTMETTPRAFGRRFMELLLQRDRRLTPEGLSTTERYKDPFVDLDNFVDHWWAMPDNLYVDGRLSAELVSGPAWIRRSSLVSRGMVSHGFINQKNVRIQSRLWFESHWAADIDFFGLFCDWIALSKPSIGMLHLFTDAESRTLVDADASWFRSGSFGGPAKPGLPNIGWAMAYGREYAAEVDVSGIRAAGFLVDEIGDALIVRVTERMSDLAENFAQFSCRRAELKSRFRPELFWIKDEAASQA